MTTIKAINYYNEIIQCNVTKCIVLFCGHFKNLQLSFAFSIIFFETKRMDAFQFDDSLLTLGFQKWILTTPCTKPFILILCEVNGNGMQQCWPKLMFCLGFQQQNHFLRFHQMRINRTVDICKHKANQIRFFVNIHTFNGGF